MSDALFKDLPENWIAVLLGFVTGIGPHVFAASHNVLRQGGCLRVAVCATASRSDCGPSCVEE
jgi:hypothetical protein